MGENGHFCAFNIFDKCKNLFKQPKKLLLDKFYLSFTFRNLNNITRIKNTHLSFLGYASLGTENWLKLGLFWLDLNNKSINFSQKRTYAHEITFLFKYLGKLQPIFKRWVLHSAALHLMHLFSNNTTLCSRFTKIFRPSLNQFKAWCAN
jgi:hypothetical protein